MSSNTFPQSLEDILSAQSIAVSNSETIVSTLKGKINRDIDFIIKPDAIDSIKDQLLAEGFHVEIKRNSPNKLLFFRYDQSGNNLIMLDLYWKYGVQFKNSYLELTPDFQNKIFEHTKLHESGLKIPEPRYRLFFILLGILTKGHSHSHYSDELALLEKALPEFSQLLGERGISEKICSEIFALLKGDEPANDNIIAALTNSFLVRKSLSPFANKWIFTFVRWIPYVWRNLPPVISIVGLDGTGKSTLNKELLSRLPIKARTIYWGSRNMILPTTRLYRFAERKLFKRDIRRTDIPEQKTDSIKAKKPLELTPKSIAKQIILFLLNINKYLEYLAKYSLLTAHRIRGTVIFTDRYTYDEHLEYEAPFYTLNRIIYKHAYFKPDILIVTTASAETIHERKPSIPVEVAAHHVNTYLSIGTELSSKGVSFIELSSNNNLDENVNIALSTIFECWEHK